MVKAGSVQWDSTAVSLQFILSDLATTEISVSYKGSPPDMFKENAGVVVQGHISADGKMMKASKLMVKHSEEYKIPKDQHAVDPELLKQSLFKE